MNVLVTGGAGYIGSHTCLELLEKGCGVVVIDNLCNSNPRSLERVQALAGKTLKFYEGDVRDAALLRKIFAENDIGCVIHFAGLKAVGESVTKPWEYYDNNLNATLVLTKVMGEVGIKKLIFSSSATVYSAVNEMPLRETSATGGCTNPYGWTKYMTEQILSGIANADPEWSVCLLRYFNPIGAHESGLLGDDPNGIPNNLMPYIGRVAAGQLEKLTIFGDDYPTPDGTCQRDYLHVVDLAVGHLKALEFAKDYEGVEAINLGTGNGISVLELVHAFQTANNMELPYVIGPRRDGDLAAFWADATKAKNLLGWVATHTVEDMCRSAWHFAKHQ